MRKNQKKRVISHLKGDIAGFTKEAAEDRVLIHQLKGGPMKKKTKKNIEKGKISHVMQDFKEGELTSGSKKGPVVRKRKQAIAIALSEARSAGKAMKKVTKKRKR